MTKYKVIIKDKTYNEILQTTDWLDPMSIIETLLYFLNNEFISYEVIENAEM